MRSLRLGGYLAFRELRSTSYNSKMKTEIKSGDDMSVVAKCAIWISAALLYADQAFHLREAFVPIYSVEKYTWLVA